MARESRTWRTSAGLGTLAIVAFAAFATVAAGAVIVYKNNFSARGEFQEIRRAGEAGKCSREWSRKKEVMRATVKDGPKSCRYRPPVQADAPQADYTIVVEGKISKETPSSVRDEAYTAVAARVGGGKEYELRVFPKEGRFSLRREPDDGAFPAEGTNPVIKGVGGRNVLRLDVDGAQVKGQVNGTTVANVTDPNPGGIDGTKLEFRLGSTSSSSKNTHGAFDRLKVLVPDP
jgi:hypothetical protein